jgi:peptidyl-prolyl cis-trans isomerase C
MNKFWQGFLIGSLLTLVVAANLAPSIFAKAQAQQEEVFYRGKGAFVKTAEENLRAAPGGERIGVLYKGANMIVLQEQDKWLYVNIRGFIWKESVTGERGLLRGQPYRAFMILLKTETEAQEILKQLQSGSDFQQLAAQKSIAPNRARGGDLGDAYPGDFSAEYEQAILALKVNDISGVIKTQQGFAIFKRIK